MSNTITLTHDQSARLFALVADLRQALDMHDWVSADGFATELDKFAAELDPANKEA